MNRVKELIDKNETTIYRLACDAKVNRRTLYDMATKQIPIDRCRYGALRKVAAALGVEIEDLRADS